MGQVLHGRAPTTHAVRSAINFISSRIGRMTLIGAGSSGVPEDVVFKIKPDVALERITAAHDAGVARGVVLADAGHGDNTRFRTAVSALGLRFVMGVLGSISVWAPGQKPLAPKSRNGRGRPDARLRRDQKRQPVSAKELADRALGPTEYPGSSLPGREP